MAKRSQLDTAILKVRTEIETLRQVLERLQAEQTAKPARKPKAKLVPEHALPGRSQP